MPLVDTGRTGSLRNMKTYGVDLGTTSFGTAAITFVGQEKIYDSLLTELGLVDMTVSAIGLHIPYSKIPRNPIIINLHLRLVETTEGGDSIIDQFAVTVKCSAKKVESAISTLVGKTLGNKRVQAVYTK